jgi:hypothetical protein
MWQCRNSLARIAWQRVVVRFFHNEFVGWKELIREGLNMNETFPTDLTLNKKEE